MPAKILTLHTMTFQYPITEEPEKVAESAIKGFIKACDLGKLDIVGRPYAMANMNLFDNTIIDVVVRGAVRQSTNVPVENHEKPTIRKKSYKV